jgi:hypothetical protein
MNKIYLTESEVLSLVKKNVEQKRLLDKWENLNEEEKEAVVKFSNILSKRKDLVKESWYNTVGDIVGIFDPTGVVDLVNGISYISQGENLFGFLSIISAVPYAGDVIAKPMMGALKLGAPSAKAMNSILKTAKAGDTVKAGADLAKLADTGGVAGTFVKGMEKVGPVLKDIVQRVPGGFMTSGLKNTILGWIELFSKAGVRAKQSKQVIGNLAKTLPKMSPAVATKKLESLSKAIKLTPGVFTGYRTTKGLFSWKTVFGGMPQLMGRNKSVRALMRQSKWWLGFLDYLGLGNWVGPDELVGKLGGEEAMRQKMEEYNKTPEAQRNFEDEYGAEEPQQNQSSSSTDNKSNTRELDPLAKLLRNLLTGQLNPLPI